MKSHPKPRVNLVAVFALVSVIAIAGCLGGGKDRNLLNRGQDSLSISIDAEGKTTFDSLQPFTVTVRAENVGSFDVFNVSSRLQGYDGIISTETPVALLSDERSLSPSTLDRPQPDKKVPGGTGAADWDVAAPFIPVDSPDREIILTGEVLYDTKSLATQRVVAATRDYIDDREKSGQDVPVIPETESVSGPVAIDLEIPIPYVKVIQKKNDFPVRVHVFNDGSGHLWNGDISESDFLSRVVMKVPPGVGVDTKNCDFKQVGPADLGVERTLLIDLQNNRQKLRLLEGGVERDLNCHLYVDSDYSQSGFNTFDLSIAAYYTYSQDVSKTLTIQGTEQPPVTVRILSPTRDNPETWEGATSTNHVCFEALYQNVELTSGLTLPNINKLALDENDITSTATSLRYSTTPVAGCNGLTDVWDLTVPNPRIGTPTSAFDLTVEVTYQAETGSDTERDAVLCAAASCPAQTP